MKSFYNPLAFIDNFLNKTPMYRLVIYALTFITIIAFGLSITGFLDYSPLSMLLSLTVILITTFLINSFFSRALHLVDQYESSLITALILFLILMPIEDLNSFWAVILASVFAMASKYIFVYRNTHIFNPAALGIYAVTLSGLGTAFWWVGSMYLLPAVLLAGLLVIRKTRRDTLFIVGMCAGVVGAFIVSLIFQQDFLIVLKGVFISGPIIFFLSIMVTEPHTIAKNRTQQILYTTFIILLPTISAITQILIIPPELSLLIANIVSLYLSERKRLILCLKKVTQLSDDMFEYIFTDKFNPSRIFKFDSGEFMEWNLNHPKSDDRGTRRYFTISSAPNNTEIAFATKYAPKEDSTFKLALKKLNVGDTVYASQLGGDFIIGENVETNIVQIAGGIGVTPFISQIRDLLQKKEKRNITLFYCVKKIKDIVYPELLEQAATELEAKIVCVVSDESVEVNNPKLSPLFSYESGFMSKEILEKHIDKNSKTDFYISGPNMMVDMLKTILHTLKIKDRNIHTDYFPGF